MTLTNPSFSLVDMNTQCLIRQEVQLFSESFKNGFYLFIFIIYICLDIHPTSHPASPKTLKNTQSGSYIIPHKLYANVLVIVLIETSESFDAKSK
jgi:hypothetical protein